MDHITFISDWNEELKRAIGKLEAQRGATKVSLPLAEVDIQAKVAGRVAEVTITQSFRNPYPEHLEAVYTFSLAGNASVSSFKMQVGSRTVIGTIQERRAAREQYAKALSEGKRAALLEQERDDVFTMQVGNIPSGEDVKVILSYTEKLQFFENGTTELRLPLVVAPRYIPGNAVAREQVGDGVEQDTDEVPDASRISPPRLAAGLDSCVSLNLCVELTKCVGKLSDTGRESSQLQVADLSCSQHAVKTSTSADCVQIKLARQDELLNRDFVLRWRTTGAKISTSLVFNQEKDGERSVSYGMLSVLPPVYDEVGRPPRDVVFIIDRSGSMEGTKMTSAARACSILLQTLGPDDRFAICAFDTESEWLQKGGQSFFNADESGIQSGIKYLKELYARGGTELLPALNGAMKVLQSRSLQTRLPVVVILTDGDVGNESNLFKFVQKELNETRIFTVGIDTAVNFGLLDRLAKLAGGTSIFVAPGSQLEEALAGIGREIGCPLITDLVIEPMSADVEIDVVAPNRVPDLFEGRTADCFLKFSTTNGAEPKFRIKGKRIDGKEFVEVVSGKKVELDAVARLWAREYVRELEDSFRVANTNPDKIRKQIIELSIKYSILTKFTAFAAVDEEEIVNNSGSLRQVVQPVHMPDQWQDMDGAPMTLAQSISHRLKRSGSYGCANIGKFDAPLGFVGGASGGNGPSGPAEKFGCSGSWGAAGPSLGASSPNSQPSAGGWGTSASSDDMETGSWRSCESSDGGWGAPPEGGSWDGPPASIQQAETGSLSAWAQSLGANEPQAQAQAPSPPPPSAPSPQPPASLPSQPFGGSIQERRQSNIVDLSAPWSTMKKLFSGGASTNQKPPATAPFERVKTAVANYKAVWTQAWDQLEQGHFPVVEQIETARKELLEALADHPIGFEVPLMQKHLRATAVEFISALRTPNMTVAKLRSLRSKLDGAYRNAEYEAEAAISRSRGRDGAFWESAV